MASSLAGFSVAGLSAATERWVGRFAPSMAGSVCATLFNVRAYLTSPPATDAQQARRALEKAERNCLISSSLKATIHLETEVDVVMEPRERGSDFFPIDGGKFAESCPGFA